MSETGSEQTPKKNIRWRLSALLTGLSAAALLVSSIGTIATYYNADPKIRDPQVWTEPYWGNPNDPLFYWENNIEVTLNKNFGTSLQGCLIHAENPDLRTGSKNMDSEDISRWATEISMIAYVPMDKSFIGRTISVWVECYDMRSNTLDVRLVGPKS